VEWWVGSAADRPLHQSNDAVDQTMGSCGPVRPGKTPAFGQLAFDTVTVLLNDTVPSAIMTPMK
jgi:hypothetical protein